MLHDGYSNSPYADLSCCSPNNVTAVMAEDKSPGTMFLCVFIVNTKIALFLFFLSQPLKAIYRHTGCKNSLFFSPWFTGICPKPLKNRDVVTLRSWQVSENEYVILNFSVKHPVCLLFAYTFSHYVQP